MVTRLALLASLIAGQFATTAAAVELLPADIQRLAPGLAAGLVVDIGAADAHRAMALAATGTMLVQVVLADSTQRGPAIAALRQAGLAGLVTVEAGTGLRPRLPWADGVVNLAIIDADRLGGGSPSDEEIQRILVPNGTALVQRKGVWTAIRAAMPAGQDGWTHWNHGPDANPLSRDRLVGVPTGIQWQAWYERRDTSGEGLHGTPSWVSVIDQGRIVQLLRHDRRIEGQKRAERELFWDGRDADNGLALWSFKPDCKSASRTQLARPILVGDCVYTTLGRRVEGGKLVALDAATGRVRLVYEAAGAPAEDAKGHAFQTLVAGGLLVSANGDRLVAMDPVSGTARWTWTEPSGRRLLLPAADAGLDMLVVGVAGEDGVLDGRFPHSRIGAIQSFQLSTGKPGWRSTAFIGKGGGSVKEPLLSQITLSGAHVGLFADGNYGDPMIGVLDATTGGLRWVSDYQIFRKYADPRPGMSSSYWANPPGKFFGQGMVFRDDGLLLLTKSKCAWYDPPSGEVRKLFEADVPNNRCVRAYATNDWLMMGFTVFLARDQRWTYRNITRSTCGAGGIPARGKLYYGPNGECGCAVWLRSAACLTSAPLPPDLEDADRLVLGSPLDAADAPVAGSPTIDGPVPRDWLRTDRRVASTPPVDAGGGRSLVAIPDEHRLECRTGDKVLWSRTITGRISAPPLVAGASCYAASTDGRLYAIAIADGRLAWRFTAARAERRIVAWSQVESASPLANAVLHRGLVWCAAGRQPEIDGGILVWGLDPVSGAIRARQRFSTTNPMIGGADGAQLTSTRNGMVNVPLTVEGDALKLAGVAITAIP